MSITACYAMDLYCDVPGCKHKMPWQYTGETWEHCARQARRAGWRINRRRHTAICPACSGKPDKRAPVKMMVRMFEASGDFSEPYEVTVLRD